MQTGAVPTQNIMYKSLFEKLIAEPLFSPIRTVYVVSDSQVDEIKRNQCLDELNKLEISRKKLEDLYKSRIVIIDERKHELQEEIKSLSSQKK